MATKAKALPTYHVYNVNAETKTSRQMFGGFLFFRVYVCHEYPHPHKTCNTSIKSNPTLFTTHLNQASFRLILSVNSLMLASVKSYR